MEEFVSISSASVASKHLHAIYHSYRTPQRHPNVAKRRKSHPCQVSGRRCPTFLHALRPVPQGLGNYDLRPQPQAAPFLPSPRPARQVEGHPLFPQCRRHQEGVLLLHPIQVGRCGLRCRQQGARAEASPLAGILHVASFHPDAKTSLLQKEVRPPLNHF